MRMMRTPGSFLFLFWFSAMWQLAERVREYPHPGFGRQVSGVGALVTGVGSLESGISNDRASHRLAAPGVLAVVVLGNWSQESGRRTSRRLTLKKMCCRADLLRFSGRCP